MEARWGLLSNTMMINGLVAAVIKENGDWNNAEQLEVQVMDMRKKLLGAEHPHTLYSMANIAIMLRFSPYFAFTPPFLHYDYLISLLQGHMAIHAPPL